MYLLIFWRENSNIFHLKVNDARFARNRRQCRLFEWFSDTVVIEIEIWHCFNSVKGRRNICGVSWNCLVVSSPPFLIEVENPLLGRMMPPTSSLYHYGIVSHHSQKLAKITVYFFFLHQWRVGSLKTQCLKITWNVSFQNSREKSVFFFQMLFEFAAQNGQHYNFNLQFVKQYFFWLLVGFSNNAFESHTWHSRDLERNLTLRREYSNWRVNDCLSCLKSLMMVVLPFSFQQCQMLQNLQSRRRGSGRRPFMQTHASSRRCT